LNGQNLDGRRIRLDAATQKNNQNQERTGGYPREDGNFGGNKGGSVNLSQNDKNAKKGAIGDFLGKKTML
jgi:hypothetical protein